MKGIKKLFSSASSVLTLLGLGILATLAFMQGVEATKVVAIPIFLITGGHAATRAYKAIKGGGEDEK